MNDFPSTFVAATRPVRYAAAAALGVLALFLLVLTIHELGNLGRSDNPYMNTITVQGTGKAAAVPNIAQITFSVTESAATVSEAQASATRKTDAALAAVKGLGIDDKDVKTVGYYVNPKYEYPQPCYSGICPTTTREPKITGYEVSQTIEVKVRDTAKAGDVLQALGTQEVQNISGPNFMVDEDDAVKNEARAEAIKNAEAKAEELAKELGVHLGKVVSFSDNNGGYPMYDSYAKGGMMMEAAAAPAPSLPVGQNETNVTVTITYEIR